uniref:Uncharacterized protein n=1 Tax=viral metagenome TaxID=1070528 RepID=A0A6C0B1J7_9ZZZZ
MDSSYFSLLIFILITILYYLLVKPKLTIHDLTSEAYTAYSSRSNTLLACYFLLVVISQLLMNSMVIINTCGGSLTQNFGAAFLLTVIPWFFIFGMVIIVLIMFPGFKSAFSNVIGYFAVSNSANNTLTTLLMNTDLTKTIDESTSGDEEQNKNLKSAAEAIIKLCGNMSILINQIVPGNFTEYWSMLTPLMKPEYQKDGDTMLKQQLLDIVVLRDNIGEAMWYVYTAILLISITQYNIMKRGCVGDLATLQTNHDQYLEQEATTQAANEKAKSTVYTY